MNQTDNEQDDYAVDGVSINCGNLADKEKYVIKGTVTGRFKSKKITKTIWALFAIANDYNQPDNDLVAFWFNKPNFEQLSKVFNITINKRKLKNLN